MSFCSHPPTGPSYFFPSLKPIEPQSQPRDLYAHLPSCYKHQLTSPHRRWISRVGKAEALEKAGVTLPPSGSKDIKDVPEAAQKDQGAIKVVTFDIVSVVLPILFVRHRRIPIAPLNRRRHFVKYIHERSPCMGIGGYSVAR